MTLRTLVLVIGMIACLCAVILALSNGDTRTVLGLVALALLLQAGAGVLERMR